MMTKTTDIHWLAGLLEGEGCFSSTEGYPSIMVKMVDRDVIERAQAILRPVVFRNGGNDVRGYGPYDDTRQRQYVAKIAGRRAAGWMMTLYPLMGGRRQARIRNLLAMWITK